MADAEVPAPTGNQRIQCENQIGLTAGSHSSDGLAELLALCLERPLVRRYFGSELKLTVLSRRLSVLGRLVLPDIESKKVESGRFSPIPQGMADPRFLFLEFQSERFQPLLDESFRLFNHCRVGMQNYEIVRVPDNLWLPMQTGGF